MRPYLLRHPGGLVVVGAFAIADIGYRRLFLHEPLRNFLPKGPRK